MPCRNWRRNTRGLVFVTITTWKNTSVGPQASGFLKLCQWKMSEAIINKITLIRKNVYLKSVHILNIFIFLSWSCWMKVRQLKEAEWTSEDLKRGNQKTGEKYRTWKWDTNLEYILLKVEWPFDFIRDSLGCKGLS